jgi:Immunity protein 8
VVFELEIKGIDSGDVPHEFQQGSPEWPDPFPDWSPADLEDFGLQLTITIGQLGVNSADNFQYYVCTRKFHAGMNRDEKRRLRLSKHEFVERYDWPTLRKIIRDRLKSCEGQDWNESLGMLRKKFHWEYENYNDSAPHELH